MVKVKNASKVYTMGSVKVNALYNTSLDISKGEFLAIMGASGSGKSTLLHIIGGIDDCTSGEIFIDGKCISNMTDTEITIFRRKNIGIVFQFFNLMPTLTVEENIALPLKISGNNPKSKKTLIDELLQITGLYEKRGRKPNQLSGGEQQRAAIARAFAIDPKIVLLDEPTGSLDSKNGEKILQLLRKAHEEYGVTVIMVTHSPFAAEYANKTIFMKDGRIFSSYSRNSGGEYSSKSIYEKMVNM